MVEKLFRYSQLLVNITVLIGAIVAIVLWISSNSRAEAFRLEALVMTEIQSIKVDVKELTHTINGVEVRLGRLEERLAGGMRCKN